MMLARFFFVLSIGSMFSCEKERQPEISAQKPIDSAVVERERKVIEQPIIETIDVPLTGNPTFRPVVPVVEERPLSRATGSQGAHKKAKTGNSDDDVDDYCLNDPEKLRPGICGCGVPDEDVDSDNVTDCEDDCIDIDADEDCASADFCPTVPTVETIVDLGSAVNSPGPVASGETTMTGNDFISEDTCGGAAVSNDVAFKWTAPSAGCFNFNTNGSNFDTVLHLKSIDDCSTQLACADGGGEVLASSLVYQFAAAGDVAIIVVDGFDGEVGSFVLNITSVPCVTNTKN